MREFPASGRIAAVALAAAAAFFAAAPAVARAEEEHGGAIDWVRDPAVGLARAKLEGKLAMLYFSATW